MPWNYLLEFTTRSERRVNELPFPHKSSEDKYHCIANTSLISYFLQKITPFLWFSATFLTTTLLQQFLNFISKAFLRQAFLLVLGSFQLPLQVLIASSFSEVEALLTAKEVSSIWAVCQVMYTTCLLLQPSSLSHGKELMQKFTLYWQSPELLKVAMTCTMNHLTIYYLLSSLHSEKVSKVSNNS